MITREGIKRPPRETEAALVVSGAEKMDRHEEDREFLKKLKTLTRKELGIYLQFQACEDWRRVAIAREIKRRILEKTMHSE